MGGTSGNIVALITINFYPPNIDTYESVAVQDSYTRTTTYFDSGDVVVDFRAAMDYAFDLWRGGADDNIIQHASCSEFVECSQEQYSFDLDDNLVESVFY